MKYLNSKKILIISLLITIVYFIPIVQAAPSGVIDQPIGTAAGNILFFDTPLGPGDSETITIVFRNTGDPEEVASTIQYISLAAANTVPAYVQIDLTSAASWRIFDHNNAPRTSGTISGSVTSAKFAPWSTIVSIPIYTWELGQPKSGVNAFTGLFENDFKVLRGGEKLELDIIVKCIGVGTPSDPIADSELWFFFIASEDNYVDPPPGSTDYPTDITTISDKRNVYYSKLPGSDPTRYWLPLHNSYDPYDGDINNGHSFDQLSWNRNIAPSGPTLSFAKGRKTVHQQPEDKPNNGGTISFHICGKKFLDSNRNGAYDLQTEIGIAGVWITLLGSIDPEIKAEVFYPGLTVIGGNPVPTDNAGSYCFNIQVDLSQTTKTSWDFWIKEDSVPTGMINTTATLIGVITLEADGDRESTGNQFGNMWEYDFGDAPDPKYPTLLTNNGARHKIGDIWMGNIVDGESDGQPTVGADGDDTNGADDEDGVVFPSLPYIAGSTGFLTITVNGAVSPSKPAYLHGWIDWNQDGDWDDAFENLFSGYIVIAPGTYMISFPVPGNAKVGSTYARFRIDDDNLNRVTGEADNGEVEDYFVDPGVVRRFPPRTPTAVGGSPIYMSRSELLTPWIGICGLFGLLSVVLILIKRRI